MQVFIFNFLFLGFETGGFEGGHGAEEDAIAAGGVAVEELEEFGLGGEALEGEGFKVCGAGGGMAGAEVNGFVAEGCVFKCVNSRKFSVSPREAIGGVELARVGGVDFVVDEVGEEGLVVVEGGQVFG